MRKIYTILLILSFAVASAQVEGTWKLAPQAAALGVGPAMGDISWWANNEADLDIRACHFDDLYVLDEDGTFMNVQGDETWLEAWQGVEQDGCGAPIAPHDGSNPATWAYDSESGDLTVNGLGAYIGLAKVYNGGELTSPDDAVESIIYPVTMSENGDTMKINIEIQDGAYWHFVLVKDDASFVSENNLVKMQVYPNPATDVITLTNSSDLRNLQIFSIQGKLIYETDQVEQTVDVSNLPAGIYTLRATGKDDKGYIAKFVVE